MRVSAEVGDELAVPGQVATQGVGNDQRCRVVSGHAARCGGGETLEVAGELAAEGDVGPAARVDGKRTGGHDTDRDLRRSGAYQGDDAADRGADDKGNRSRRKASVMRKPGRSDEQEGR